MNNNESQNDDLALMARAQRFNNMPQNQVMNSMMEPSGNNFNSNNGMMGMGGMDMGGMGFNNNWNNMNNMSPMGFGNNGRFPPGMMNNNNFNNGGHNQFQGGGGGGGPYNHGHGEEGNQQGTGGNSTKRKASVTAADLEGLPIPKPAKANTPRRPLSAYNIFFSEMRGIILKEKEDEQNAEEARSKEEGGEGEQSKEEGGGKGEKDGGSTEKLPSREGDTESPTKDENENKGEETEKDMEAFTQNLMKKRLEKKPSKRAHRKSHGKVAFTALAKTVGQRWRELEEEKKTKYKDLAEIDRTRYRTEKAAIAKALREDAKKQRREAKAARERNQNV